MIERRQREGEIKVEGEIREGGRDKRERERERVRESEREREVKGIERCKARRVNPTLRLMLFPNYVSGSQADTY